MRPDPLGDGEPGFTSALCTALTSLVIVTQMFWQQRETLTPLHGCDANDRRFHVFVLLRARNLDGWSEHYDSQSGDF